MPPQTGIADVKDLIIDNDFIVGGSGAVAAFFDVADVSFGWSKD